MQRKANVLQCPANGRLNFTKAMLWLGWCGHYIIIFKDYNIVLYYYIGLLYNILIQKILLWVYVFVLLQKNVKLNLKLNVKMQKKQLKNIVVMIKVFV